MLLIKKVQNNEIYLSSLGPRSFVIDYALTDPG